MKSIKDMKTNELRRIVDLKDAVNGFEWSLKNLKQEKLVGMKIKKVDDTNHLSRIELKFEGIGCVFEIENKFIESAYKAFSKNLLKSHRQLLENLMNAE